MQGARATHPTDGDLSALVDACSPGHRLSTHGLTACSVDTSTLGNYTVSFFLSASTLSISSNVVSRTVVVHPACPESEQLCSDNTCSMGGFCFDGTRTEQKENVAPTLSFSLGDAQAVYIPRGTPYGFCNSASDPSITAGLLCDSGPVASDEEDGDITYRVLACPPVQCLSVGCPGHELGTKGLAGCGVDTENAPVGTAFNITYTVFDLNRPAASASLFRLVTVASPCALGLLYCPDSAIKCADAPCSLRDVLVESQVLLSPPELVVDLSDTPTRFAQLRSEASNLRTLSIRGLCGHTLPVDFTNICTENGSAQKPSGELWSSQTCQSSSSGDLCAVSVAQDGSTGASPTVTIVREEAPCDENSEDGCETAQCSLAALADGRCSPSRQVFRMHALHESSSAAGELQQLRVEAVVLHTVANATTIMRATVAADSPQHAVHMAALEALAPGTEQCSFVAGALHEFVAQHVQFSGACSNFRSEAAGASGFTSSDAAVAVEVTQAQYVQSEAIPDEESESADALTPVGILELSAIIEIGIISTVNASSVVHVAATACLDAAQGAVLLLDGSGEGAEARATLPLDVQTGPQPLLQMTAAEVVSVASQAAHCPEVAAEVVSIDEMTAAVENAEMQQYMHEQTATVRTSLWIAQVCASLTAAGVWPHSYCDVGDAQAVLYQDSLQIQRDATVVDCQLKFTEPRTIYILGVIYINEVCCTWWRLCRSCCVRDS